MLDDFICALRNYCQIDTHKFSYRLIGRFDNGIYTVIQRKPLNSDEAWKDFRIFRDPDDRK